MDWWGISVILVVGIAVVVYGYLDDRRKTRERDAALAAPPDRDIPRFTPTSRPPEYVSELQARKRPGHLNADALSDDDRTALTVRLKDARSIAAGYASDRFVTDASTGWAVANDPLVAVFSDGVETARELLPIMERAQRDGRALVLAAPSFSDPVLDTLAANHTQGKVHCVAIRVTAAQADELAGLTLATPLSRTDLQSGWAPAEAFGTIAIWVSDRRQSWLIDA